VSVGWLCDNTYRGAGNTAPHITTGYIMATRVAPGDGTIRTGEGVYKAGDVLDGIIPQDVLASYVERGIAVYEPDPEPEPEPITKPKPRGRKKASET